VGLEQLRPQSIALGLKLDEPFAGPREQVGGDVIVIALGIRQTGFSERLHD
jgi:hypothetical protein